MVICKTSEMDFPLKRTSSVSRLNRFPWQVSHSTYTSGRKFISMTFNPPPVHVSQRPPATLKLKRPGLYPRICASGVCVNRLLISLNTPVYVAGFDRGVRPIGL